MIENAASALVEMLLLNHIIEPEQVPAYQYGLEILISSIITCFITLLCGIALGSLPAALLYFLIFVSLRTICGGYHAQTYWQCNLIFTLVTVLILVFFRIMPLECFTELHYCILAISLLITFFFAPAENANKPLSQKKKKQFRILGTAMVALLALLSCLLKIKYQSSYSILIDMTVFVVVFFMFVADRRKEASKNEQ